jgi:hypothetical protein
VPDRDFDFLVVGHETEGVLAAITAARAGARAGIVVPEGRALGGLLTEGGLAFVDRDSRHLTPPEASPDDGLFAEFLARAGVPLVALDSRRGETALRAMLAEAGVEMVPAGKGATEGSPSDTRLDLPVEAGRGLAGLIDRTRVEGISLLAISVGGVEVSARYFLDATPDGDLLEALGEGFAFGFSEYGIDRLLGVSPLPVVTGVSAGEIVATCERLAADAGLQALKERIFGERRFLDLDRGDDYVLVGPPFLALAFQRWREEAGLTPPVAFEADGFNVAILDAETTSWNGLIYFESDANTLLTWSRGGPDDRLRGEVALFGRFLRESLGWSDAAASCPPGMYVRQTRHALGTRLRLSLGQIASGSPVRSAGTFCYYPDFRGFRVTPTSRPLVARVALDAGFLARRDNVGIASRSGGYTPPAHALCRLVQYNATLGAALGVAAALAAGGDWREVPEGAIRDALARLEILADDQAGLAETPVSAARLLDDPLLRTEAALALA